MIAPIFSGGGVEFYQGEAAEVLPQFTERGHIIFDPPYSAHVHGKSRAGARKVPIVERRWNASPIDRAVDFGFAHLTASDRRMLAAHAARLASRWVLVFSDVEGAHLWRRSLDVIGLDYARTGFWRKIGGTPQFTGTSPAVAAETITICHARAGKHCRGVRCAVKISAGNPCNCACVGCTRKAWNGGGSHGLWDEDFAPGETLWWDELTVLDRGGAATDTRLHPTQKPEGLMIALVEDFTDPGDLVYDFTAGSCTTAIACLRAKGGPRRCVCVERDPAFAARAMVRLEAELAGSTYRARESGQGSLFG